MKKYNPFKNRAELNQEQIQNSFSKKLLIGSIGIVAITSLLIYLQAKPKNETIGKIGLANNENRLKRFKLNTEKDTTIIYESGSIIKIQKNSFLDENGNDIKGEIEFFYREFHSVSETLLAGIPMKYDSAGTKLHFESAGMFEIIASKNNKPVYINKDKSIEVQLASLNSNLLKFNQYYLDGKTNKWIYLNKDTVNKITIPGIEPYSIENKANYIAQKIIKPVKANSKKQQFIIEVPKGMFPELEIFKNVIFEASSRNKNFDATKTTKNWYGVDIERTGKDNEYLITFTNHDENYELIAYPVFDTTNYKIAINKYNVLIESFEKKLNERDIQIKTRNTKLNSELSVYVEAMNKYRILIRKNQKIYNDSTALVMQNQRFTQSSQEIVYRTFQVKQFGIWNSDCPQNMPKGINLAANYVNDKGEVLKPAAVYLVEKGKNALYTFSVKQNISFNPDNETILIIITTDNVLNWVTANDFNGINATEKSHTFNVRSLKKSSYSLSDINNIII